jgi:hypothetical protein
MRLSLRPAPRALVVALALSVSLAAAGCGKSTGSVSGKVYYKNALLKGGKVIFLLANGQSAVAEIREDGSYAFDKPLATGPAKVAVVTSLLKPAGRGGPRQNTPPADAAFKPNNGLDPAEKARRYTAIPAKYEDPKQSGKDYTVVSGKQEFELKLD